MCRSARQTDHGLLDVPAEEVPLQVGCLVPHSGLSRFPLLLCSRRAQLDILTEEVPHQVGDLVAVLLEREVSGVEQVKLQGLQVSLVWLGAGWRKYLIVLSPDDQGRRLVVAEVGLPFRVQR